jgi:hypothetical protein
MSWRLPAIAAGAAVLGLSSAAVLLHGENGGFEGGPGLNVALFTPEPSPIEAGGVMDVGDLVDGYVHRPVAPPDQGMEVYETAWLPEEDYGYRDDYGPVRDERPYAREPQPEAAPPVREAFEPERERNAWGFGFDDPGPDYAAARRERRERLERRMAEEREWDRTEVYPSSAELRPSETFY